MEKRTGYLLWNERFYKHAFLSFLFAKADRILVARDVAAGENLSCLNIKGTLRIKSNAKKYMCIFIFSVCVCVCDDFSNKLLDRIYSIIYNVPFFEFCCNIIIGIPASN